MSLKKYEDYNLHQSAVDKKFHYIKEEILLLDQLEHLWQYFEKAKETSNDTDQQKFCIELFSFLQKLGSKLCLYQGNAHKLSPFQSIAASSNLFKHSSICKLLESDSTWYEALANTVKTLSSSDKKTQDPISDDLLRRLELFREIADKYFKPRVTSALDEAIASLSAVTKAVHEKLAVLMVLVMCGELIPLSQQLARILGEPIIETLEKLRTLCAHLDLKSIWALLESKDASEFKSVRTSILALQKLITDSNSNGRDGILAPLKAMEELVEKVKKVSKQRPNLSDDDAKYIKELLETVFPELTDVKEVNDFCSLHKVVCYATRNCEKEPEERYVTMVIDIIQDKLCFKNNDAGVLSRLRTTEIQNYRRISSPSKDADLEDEGLLKIMNSNSKEYRVMKMKKAITEEGRQCRQSLEKVMEQLLYLSDRTRLTEFIDSCKTQSPLVYSKLTGFEEIEYHKDQLNKRRAVIRNAEPAARISSARDLLESMCGLKVNCDGLKSYLIEHPHLAFPARYLLAAICEYLINRKDSNSPHGLRRDVINIRNYYFHCQWVYGVEPSGDLERDIMTLCRAIAVPTVMPEAQFLSL